MYQVEVFNDLSVYMTGIHGLAFTATLTNLSAYDTLGYSLGSLVVTNLVINMGFIIFDSCVQLKKKMAAKLARAQKQSRAWDAHVRANYTCDCKCLTCGGIETKTTVVTEKGKKMGAPPVDQQPAIVFSLKLTPCEVSPTPPLPQATSVVKSQELEGDDFAIKSKSEHQVNPRSQ